jgi:hypothetical protein
LFAKRKSRRGRNEIKTQQKNYSFYPKMARAKNREEEERKKHQRNLLLNIFIKQM